MSRTLHYLRIAFSITCVVAAVLLVVFWMRSYRQVDNLMVRVFGARVLTFSSSFGQLAIELMPAGTWRRVRNWHVMTQPAAPIRELREKWATPSAAAARTGLSATLRVVRPTLKFRRSPEGTILYMRYWIPVLATGFLAAILATLPWIRWRFSLRTLLIAMTLLGLILGTVVWLSR